MSCKGKEDPPHGTLKHDDGRQDRRSLAGDFKPSGCAVTPVDNLRFEKRPGNSRTITRTCGTPRSAGLCTYFIENSSEKEQESKTVPRIDAESVPTLGSKVVLDTLGHDQHELSALREITQTRAGLLDVAKHGHVG